MVKKSKRSRPAAAPRNERVLKSKLPRRANKLGAALQASKDAATAVEGEVLLQQIINGKSVEEVMAGSGLNRWQVMGRVSTLRKVSPEIHRQMVEGLRMFLGQLAVDDLMHWRPKTREEVTADVATKDGGAIMVRDYEAQKIAAAAYKDSKDTIIKVFGLQSQTLEIGQATHRPPLTADELAAKSLIDPDVREAVEAVVLAVHTVQEEAA